MMQLRKFGQMREDGTLSRLESKWGLNEPSDKVFDFLLKAIEKAPGKF